MGTELDAALAADDAAEDSLTGFRPHGTCFTHQSWFADCFAERDGVHANPVTKFNWCDPCWMPVQRCGCRPATVNG
jgi:hypothetical protein